MNIIYSTKKIPEPSNHALQCLVMSSSFNPPTFAHYRLVENAFQRGQFDMVLLLISTLNPIKPKLENAALEDRLQMMKIMADELEISHVLQRDQGYLVMDASKTGRQPVKTESVSQSDIINETNDTKFDSDRPLVIVATVEAGVFIDQVDCINACLQMPVELSFVMGFDTLMRFFDQKYYKHTEFDHIMRNFFLNSSIISADRPVKDQLFQEFMANETVLKYMKKIKVLGNWPQTGLSHVSSSSVREFVGKNTHCDIIDGVSKGISKYICKNSLYITKSSIKKMNH